MIIRNKLRNLLATIQSLDDGVIEILVFGGEPINVSFPPELHEVRAELESHLEIVKPEMSLPRFLLDGNRSFYFERIKRTSKMPGLVDAKTCSIKEVLSSAVNELLKVIEKSMSPASEVRTCDDEISREDLLRQYAITTQGLDYRIKNNGHPKPIRTEGKKQWFSIESVDRWRTKEE